MSSTKVTIKDWSVFLSDLVTWEEFAYQLLPTDSSNATAEVDKIKTDYPHDVQQQKGALYRCWVRLAASSNATWDHVIIALKGANQIAIAQYIMERLKRPSVESLRSHLPADKCIMIEDDVYDQIIISHPLLKAIIKTPQFQRLKDIKQLGVAYYVFPKATHTRYQHSLGMCFLAGEFITELKKRSLDQQIISETDVLCVKVAALCYNLGHGPFSYLYEDLFRKSIVEKGKNMPMSFNEASVEMFQYMSDYRLNPKLNQLINEYLNENDILFIKELLLGKSGKEGAARPEKHFLYEIVSNKLSGLDVSMIDSTTRDATVLGMSINFKWSKFIARVMIREVDDGLHICAHEEDLANYNDLFAIRHALFRNLHFDRKKRIIDIMVNKILVIADEKEFTITGESGLPVGLSDAATDMSAFTCFNDGILHMIRQKIQDREVQKLLDCLDKFELFIPIGYILGASNDFKNFIQGASRKEELKKLSLTKDDIIFDESKSGYQRQRDKKMYFVYTRRGHNKSPGKWTSEWQRPLYSEADNPPTRIFLAKRTSGQHVSVLKSFLDEYLSQLGTSNGGDVYEDEIDEDLTIGYDTTESLNESIVEWTPSTN